MPDTPKFNIRLDDALKADLRRCADARGIPMAEFVKQAIVHYMASLEEREKPQGKGKR